jgi:nitrogen fixation protein NifZ
VKPTFDYGDVVRLTRNVRNDGTFPGNDTGDLLIRRGSLGHVRNIGTFLQDQIIYSVHFTEDDRLVGCREEELIGEHDPWVPSRFEFRDKVVNKIPFAINGEVIVEKGMEAEVLKVLRDNPEDEVQYHVRFPGRTLQAPESALEFAAAVKNESASDD